MKHEDNKLPDALKKLTDLSKPQHFYTIGEGRYTVLFKRTLRRGPGPMGSNVALSPESWDGTLYIYDAEAHDLSPVFIINKEGILGLHGTRPAVVEQLVVIETLVVKTLRMALTAEGLKCHTR